MKRLEASLALAAIRSVRPRIFETVVQPRASASVSPYRFCQLIDPHQ